MKKLEIKKKLFALCQEAVDQKLARFQKNLQELKEAGSEHSKSSAGDKYETTTAMLHLEREKLGQQLKEAEALQASLHALRIDVHYQEVHPGCVVKTPLGNFFMAVFVGKIEVEGESYFAISPASPIGQAMASAREGDVISFRGKEYKLEQLF